MSGTMKQPAMQADKGENPVPDPLVQEGWEEFTFGTSEEMQEKNVVSLSELIQFNGEKISPVPKTDTTLYKGIIDNATILLSGALGYSRQEILKKQCVLILKGSNNQRIFFLPFSLSEDYIFGIHFEADGGNWKSEATKIPHSTGEYEIVALI